MKIGLLEDNPSILELMQIALKMIGHSVCTHVQGKSLLETIFEGHDPESWRPVPSLPYDLLIVDLNLPGEFSGQDVIISIRRLLTPDVLPIIVVSAGGLHEFDQLLSRFPTLPVVRKPFAIQTLVQTISQLGSQGKEHVLQH